MREGYTTVKVNMNQPKVETETGVLSTVGGWLGDGISAGASAVLTPIGDALGEGFKALFITMMHSLPPVLIIGGLVCFLFTIAMGNHRPYFWGLGMWAGSAIIRGFNLEAGF